MRFALLTLALALLAAPAVAADADVPKDLKEADYITAKDVEAEVPYGDLYIDEAVVAIFPHLENRLGGMVVGRTRLKMGHMPVGSAPAADGGGKPRPVEFKIERAYLSASLTSDVKVLPKGRALQARRWDDLEKEEQELFLSMYNEAVVDSWHDSVRADGTSAERDPRGKEFFTAFWAKPPRTGGEPSPSSDLVRYDFRMSETGAAASLEDRSNHGILFQLPVAGADTGAKTAPSGISP